MLVHVIADYGHHDLAFAEVIQRLKTHLPDAEPVLTPVSAFATLAAGFCVAQLGLNEAPAGTLIYHNVAPREDDDEARTANAGERLAYARLPTGVRVIGVNAGWAFSFVRDAAKDLRWAAVPAAVPEARVAYVDGYGNLKTTIRSAPKGARTVRVRIGKVTLDAIVSDGSFAVEPRQFAFAPGSSSWPLNGGPPCAGSNCSCAAATRGKPSVAPPWAPA